MPVINLEVPETQSSVIRPVVFTVTRELLRDMGLPEDTVISFPGVTDTVMQPGSEMKQEKGVNTFNFSERVFIEVDENYDPDRIIGIATVQEEYKPFFRDDALDVMMKPVYSPTDITISFRYRAKDRTTCLRWRDQLRNRIGGHWNLRNHEITYHYLVPPVMLVILKEIHRLRETVAPYNEDYTTYLKNHISIRATEKMNLNGSTKVLAIEERQVRIFGKFDFDAVPDQPNKEENGDNWITSFSYKISFEKPIACIMKYPLMVHNQLIGQAYRPDPAVDKADKLDGRRFNYSLSSNMLSYFEKKRAVIPGAWKGVIIPSFDEFVPGDVPTDTMPIVTCMVGVDPANPTALMSLKTMPDNNIAPAIIDYLTTIHADLNIPGKNVFNVCVYRGKKLLDSSLYSVDQNLNVVASAPLSLRESYHVVLNLVKDLSRFPDNIITTLRTNGVAAQIVLDTIAPYLADRGLTPNIMGLKLISTNSIKATIGEITAAGNSLNGVVKTTTRVGNIYTTVITDFQTGMTTTTVVDVGNNYVAKREFDRAVNEINRFRANLNGIYGGNNIGRKTVMNFGIIAGKL